MISAASPESRSDIQKRLGRGGGVGLAAGQLSVLASERGETAERENGRSADNNPALLL